MELLARESLKFLLPEYKSIYNHRPDWLKFPETGHNLELDVFYPELNFAVEINGKQHRLRYQRKKDQFKWETCRDRGVVLMVINNKQRLKKIRFLLESYLRNTKFTDFNRFRKRIPKKLFRQLKNYEPNPAAFGNLARRVARQLKAEVAYNIQDKETESVRRRMLAKQKV